MMKWLARKGAVGGTARWAAQGYESLSTENPGISGPELYRALIHVRFTALPNADQEQFLMSIADQVIGLRGLVVAILTVEAGFTENTPQNQRMFMEIIDEELLKHGVPRDIAFGQS
ncbi:hypothetical protein HFP89_10495 [Wenzhouxiangella sp. XN79A]|uniref:hypothetical protein n=1 Tax=Wenzhouxiangella sp. XN79A TaxID=2724193 RepID=UPI00144AC62A|nr:hypothetical protein [Wenzhouxiangella sp. XN79A]NKI35593.1 hypothetical protein [Wenzhouxiangella sp. XN79A]